MEFNQTVQVNPFPDNLRAALMGTALHCTARNLPLRTPRRAEGYHDPGVKTKAVQKLPHRPYSFGNGITFDMLRHAQCSINEVSIQPDPEPVIIS